MADNIKSPTAVLIVLILVSLSLCGGVFYLLQKERAHSLTLEDQLKELETKQKITETKLSDAKKNIMTLETQVQESQAKIDGMTTELETAKTAKQQAEDQLSQMQVQLDEVKNT
jgi:uncharacterized protein HemX